TQKMAKVELSLTKSNAGTLVLTGTLSYHGATTVAGGTLRLGSSLTTISALSAQNDARIELISGGNRIIRTAAVTVSDTARIDLKDNKMIVAAGDIGSWNGTAYT